MNKDQIIQTLNEAENDSPVARAELARFLVKTIYNFVKMERPEGEGLDGRDGPERRSMGKIVDAAENHYFNMIKESHEKQGIGRRNPDE
ncbi:MULTISPECIES: hypothetical protein [Enterobacteriaceae]|uniref:hypothetical protein n=1 Tax=Enterobacteriaceae TaxID=543 RepID=UPI00149558FB|nr:MULTISPECIES: hypothetical protein [Enterobacteriaceae]HBZ3306320.1 hypothetical protein [Klebsiella pneumoniae]MCO1573897.1 hypothetical protein [Enterobacter hormaechei]HCW3069827.1 hypothetical protein [Citrobacter freundii]HCW3106873.1 hypothetical protein [Citrobacter freundii]HCW3132181.1 hypothetical protein [Citrobacter freundii]